MKDRHLPAAEGKDKDYQEKPDELLFEIREIIDGARSNVARSVNSELVMMYWTIGNLTFHNQIIINSNSGYAKFEQRLFAIYQIWNDRETDKYRDLEE